MARNWQTPGGPYVYEDGTDSYQIPGGPYITEDQAAAGGAWTGKINGVTNPGKVNGVAAANINKINGVA
jgi:hypothetical protein